MTEHEEATLLGEEMRRNLPWATSALFDVRLGKVIVELSSGVGIFFDPKDAQGLSDAAPEDLSPIEITPSGYGLHFPKLDADLYVPGLLEGKLGTKRWMESRVDRSPYALSQHRAAS